MNHDRLNIRRQCIKLPLSLKSITPLDMFKTALKTFLFAQACVLQKLLCPVDILLWLKH